MGRGVNSLRELRRQLAERVDHTRQPAKKAPEAAARARRAPAVSKAQVTFRLQAGCRNDGARAGRSAKGSPDSGGSVSGSPSLERRTGSVPASSKGVVRSGRLSAPDRPSQG